MGMAKAIDTFDCVKTGKGNLTEYNTYCRFAYSLKQPWSKNPDRVTRALTGLSKIKLTLSSDAMKIPTCDEYFILQPNKRDYVIDPTAIIAKLSDLRFSCIMTFLDKFAVAIAPALREDGKLGFFDYLLYFRDMLKTDALNGGRLIGHIQKKHRHYLIDEFQDTNPLQYEIMFYLTAKEPVSEWKKCVPLKGSLFIVGDPKQSIYRFRNADIAAYQEVKALFKGEVGETLTFYLNFRSTKLLRDWLNSVFPDIMPEDTTYQAKYEPIADGGREAVDGEFTGIFKYHTTSSAEPGAVASMLHELCNNDSKLIPKSDGLSEIEWRDIMVLTCGKDKLSDFMKTFTESGIPFSVEGKTAFDKCGAFVDICAVIMAIASPYDTFAIAAALTSGAFLLSLASIQEYVQSSGRLILFEKARASDCATADALNSLLELRNACIGISPVSAFWHVENVLGIISRHVLTDEELLDYFHFAAELLRQAVTDCSVTTLLDTAKFLNSLLSNTNEHLMRLVDEMNGVRLINLHKVKGLESPVVILAGPYRGSSSVQKTTIREDDKMKSIFFSVPMGDGYGNTLETSEFPGEKETEESHDEAEYIRLCYVAATRAKQVLIVSSQPNSDALNNSWHVFLSHISADMMIPDEIPAAAVEYGDLDKSVLQNIVAKTHEAMSALAEISYQSIILSGLIVKSRVTSNDLDENTVINTAEPIKDRLRNAPLIGTMVHRLLEMLVFMRRNKVSIDTENLAFSIVNEFINKDEDQIPFKAILDKVAKTMISGGFTQSHLENDLLKLLDSADDVYTEVPFCLDAAFGGELYTTLKTENAPERIVINGKMDLVYRIGDRWNIIDYKTNLEGDLLNEKYENQLVAYKVAFKELTGCKADAMVYHVVV